MNLSALLLASSTAMFTGAEATDYGDFTNCVMENAVARAALIAMEQFPSPENRAAAASQILTLNPDPKYTKALRAWGDIYRLLADEASDEYIARESLDFANGLIRKWGVPRNRTKDVREAAAQGVYECIIWVTEDRW